MSKLMTSNSLASVALLFMVAISGTAAGTPSLTGEVISKLVLDDATAFSFQIEPWPLPPPETRKVVGQFCYLFPCDKDGPNWHNIYED
ncbi:hypothetical protein [Pseudomonas khavaziana]|uniref:hypothetical protein n=1 Tax=Pseudomonas khavaziana TaxID=2842351 RepID=UPI001C3C6676|nr:hypothetical protein [Pseudomonas khavaziana]MBV4479945.1 hypothetical protein [Pseudomonas khavaziana]